MQRFTPVTQVALVSSLAGLAYFLVFGAQFAFYDRVPGGDTQNVWSAYWIAIYSVRRFGEFLWWDPTALNGWPAHYLTNHGWTTLLSPFQLAQLSLGLLVNAVSNLEITRFLVLQKTLLAVAINIVGITLVSRELVQSTIARIFPPLVYAVCQIQFLGFVAAATVDALPAAIFLLYSLVRYNNRRTPGSLLILVLFSGVYATSINYMTLTSHVYPLGFLFALILALFPGFLGSLRANAALLTTTRLGTSSLATGLMFILAGAVVFVLGVSDNLQSFARLVTGAVPYDIGKANTFDPPGYGIVSTEAWTNLFYWIPYNDFHAFSLKFDPYSSGNDYRSIGLATLPLIIVAIAAGHRRRYVACLGVAFLLCITLVTLTHRSLPLSLLIEESSIFKNIRTMALIMPRDLACLFPIFVAAIGLDAVVTKGADGGNCALQRLVDVALVSFSLLAGWCLLQPAISPDLVAVRKSMAHIGVFLPIFCVILLSCVHTRDERLARCLGWFVLLFSFVDLSASASDQWLSNNKNGRYHHGSEAVSMKAEFYGVGPIASESESWTGTYYSGMVHNVHHGGPHFGLKYWLALVTRPSWQPVVETWNPASRMVTRYPHFKFFTNGAYVPEEAIYKIDSVTPPAVELPGRIIESAAGAEIRLDGRRYPVVDAEVGFVEHVQRSGAWPDRYSMKGWAIDRSGGKPARQILVFLGEELWYTASPNEFRPDIAKRGAGLLRSGFLFEIPKLPDSAVRDATSIRVFVITHDDHAAELRYSDGYPFVRSAGKKGPVKLEPTAVAQAGRPTFYVHDASLVRPGVPGRRLHDVKPEILKFTLNRVKVRVNLPEPSYMVFLDNFHPGWKAYVNGDRTTIHRANFTFKTIFLPAGTSEVEWVFSPLRIKLAWILYYLLFASVIALFLLWARANRATANRAI